MLQVYNMRVCVCVCVFIYIMYTIYIFIACRIADGISRRLQSLPSKSQSSITAATLLLQLL